MLITTISPMSGLRENLMQGDILISLNVVNVNKEHSLNHPHFSSYAYKTNCMSADTPHPPTLLPPGKTESWDFTQINWNQNSLMTAPHPSYRISCLPPNRAWTHKERDAVGPTQSTVFAYSD